MGLILKSTRESLVGCPAGQPTRAAGQQPEGALVEGQRDRRVFDWLIEQVGAESVAAAYDRLEGRRRPYPSNLAKVLGLTPPANLALASSVDIRRCLAECKALLKSGK